jgi:hypothetical protein
VVSFVIAAVRSAINFHDQPSANAGEIRDVRPYRMLPAESLAIDRDAIATRARLPHLSIDSVEPAHTSGPSLRALMRVLVRTEGSAADTKIADSARHPSCRSE